MLLLMLCVLAVDMQMRIYIGFFGVLPELRGFKHADKITHAIYGGVIGVIAAWLASSLGLDIYLMALAASVVAGVGKEIYDAITSDGRWDPWDILATIILPLLALIFLS